VKLSTLLIGIVFLFSAEFHRSCKHCFISTVRIKT